MPDGGVPFDPGGSQTGAGEGRGERLGRLLRKARALPSTPGVYLLKDRAGVVLYVGKAARLPGRVSSYFVPSADLGHAKQGLLDLVHDIEHLECETEWEALLTENRLIKDIKPRFNARLTDDKTFPYLVVTQREDYPRVFITRSPADPGLKGARVYGPFTAVGALREAVQHLQRVFKFRTCSLDIVEGEAKNRYFRPCILHAIGQCTAPCAELVGREAYRRDVERFVRALESKRSVMLREMREEMERAAAGLEFERAAALRDQVRAIERLEDRAPGRGGAEGWQPETESGIAYLDPAGALASLGKTLGVEGPIRCIEGFDVAHLQGGETVGSKVCFIDGRPLKSEYRRYRIRTVADPLHGNLANDDYASIREVVSRRYREAGKGEEVYPDVVLIDGGLGQLHAALGAFEGLAAKPPMVVSIAKKEELLYVQRRTEGVRLGRENLGLRLCQAVRDEAHRFAQRYHHVLRRKRVTGE